MKNLIILFLFIACLFMTACSDKYEPEGHAFVKDAGIKENGETLSPGSIVHMEGSGYRESDDVILNFFWETGDKIIPEGCIKGYHAKVISTSTDGMTIQMPFRKPASRVEVNLMREGKIMHIGNVNLTDGLTPKELNLYGINNDIKIKTSIEKQITRWVYKDNNTSDLKSWVLDTHPDFHSAVGARRAYGICGLANENGNQYPFFFDLCTQEWNRLSDLNTIALFSNGNTIGAIQSLDGKLYGANEISHNLDRSDDYLISRSSLPAMGFQLPLPDGIEAEQFGEFPGTYTERGVLLSADRGNGKWVPVFFSPTDGFSISDEIEAKRLIPFAVRPSVAHTAVKDATENPRWIAGFIVVKENFENGSMSFLYAVDDNLSLSQEPIATFPNQALSATANHDRPGTLTVHFEAYRSGNVTSEYSFDKQKWTPINASGTFDEIVWIN